jgi:hypothetical protein
MKPMLALIAVIFGTNSYFAQIVKDSERMLLDTEHHIVLVSLKGNAVVFTMEAITDFTEDRDYTKPLGIGQDYAGIRVDINNNNVVDRSIDVAFGIRQNTNIFCPQFLFHEYASSACGGNVQKEASVLSLKKLCDKSSRIRYLSIRSRSRS